MCIAGAVHPGEVLSDRLAVDLSQYDWHLYRDFEAEWIGDEIHLPPVDVSSLPAKPPTCGWDELEHRAEKTVHLPATVEEHFWGGNGNDSGVAGDYRGVSWWTTHITLGPEIEGKRVFLDFASVHLRAEVFVNRRLVGYDVIGHTPFSVDITDAVIAGDNEIAVRITDPAGNFSWNDRQVLTWGNRQIPAVHGFGGITGPVALRAVDPVHVTDIFIMNTPSITDADAVITLNNLTGKKTEGTIIVTVTPRNRPGEIIWKKTYRRTLEPGVSELTAHIGAKDAEPWDLDNPNLHIVSVAVETGGGTTSDTMTKRFGFRWFDIGEKNGDQRLYLNGKRIVLRGGMSWGFWPVNGVYATPEMAAKEVSTAKELGLTYMNFHRAIGQPRAMDAADEMGFLTYEEPGGYSCEGADPSGELWRGWRREKLLRMVRRDRSRPSLVIYNLQNRTPNPLTDEDRENMRAAHELDPTRILTFISGFWKKPPKENPDKLFFRPYDDTEYYTGWFDMHNHTPEFGYADHFYNGPTDYLRYTGTSDEVIFWGEDGGLYGAPRLKLIRDYHDERGENGGWMAGRFLDWYEAWDGFLDSNGFRRFYPDIDAFTTAIGNVTLDYHGRIIENIRAGNLDDCYTINGWAAPHLVNQSEVADLYRNPVGDPAILARYCRPLYVAVKLRDRVAPVATTLTADIYLINEANLRGNHRLAVQVTGPDGVTTRDESFAVKLVGGEEYGQLLVEGVDIPLGAADGYYAVEARLVDRNDNTRAEGRDEAYAVDIAGGVVSRNGAVLDDSGAAARFFERTWGFTPPAWDEGTAGLDYIVIGGHEFRNANDIAPVMDRVADGATAIVLTHADRFAGFLVSGNIEAVDYRGALTMGKGNFVAGDHTLLDGLPMRKAFGWEYQAFYTGPGRSRSALILKNVETIVAAVSGSARDVGTALTVVPYGRGNVILTTLSLLPLLNDDTPQSSVARRMMTNMVRFGSDR